jgi:hypothetical protein
MRADAVPRIKLRTLENMGLETRSLCVQVVISKIKLGGAMESHP